MTFSDCELVDLTLLYVLSIKVKALNTNFKANFITCVGMRAKLSWASTMSPMQKLAGLPL
jgi:hypothetical protein